MNKRTNVDLDETIKIALGKWIVLDQDKKDWIKDREQASDKVKECNMKTEEQKAGLISLMKEHEMTEVVLKADDGNYYKLELRKDDFLSYKPIKVI